MPKKTAKIEPVKSKKSRTNKQAPFLNKDDRLYLESFKKRFLLACWFHMNERKYYYTSQRTDAALIDILDFMNKTSKEIKKKIEKIRNERPHLGINYHMLLKGPYEDFYNLIKSELSRKPGRAGHPAVKGDLALLIYVALEKGLKNRIFLEEVGRLIAAHGPIHKIVDKRFGEGSYYSFNIPTVDLKNGRWEKSKKSDILKPAALKHLQEILKENSHTLKDLSEIKVLSEIEYYAKLEKAKAEIFYSSTELKRKIGRSDLIHQGRPSFSFMMQNFLVEIEDLE